MMHVVLALYLSVVLKLSDGQCITWVESGSDTDPAYQWSDPDPVQNGSVPQHCLLAILVTYHILQVPKRIV